MKGGGSLWLTGRRGSPQGLPNTLLRGPSGRQCFRAGSPGIRVILPCSRVAGECENQLLRNPQCGEEAG